MSLKVVHVLSGLGLGGIEKWLVSVSVEMRRLYGDDIQVDFLTFILPDGYFAAQLKASGFRIYHCQLIWTKFPEFIYRLASHLLKEHYDVVHCHADYLSGLVLPVAHAMGVKVRVGHIHNTQFAFQARRPLARYCAGIVLRRLHIWDGGYCVGTSMSAIDAYLGDFKRQIFHQVCACGIVCADYRQVVDRDKLAIIQSLNLPVDFKFILHVGRHSEQKNLLFLLEILSKVFQSNANVMGIFAGAGPMTGLLNEKARALGILDKIHFLGNRDDVPRLMRAADLFVFPSLYEGLGLAVVEAQMVGLRSLISEVIPDDVEIIHSLVHRLSLRESSTTWAECVLRLIKLPAPDPINSLNLVEASQFNITNSAQTLMALYTK